MKRSLTTKLAAISAAALSLAPLAARAAEYDYDYTTTTSSGDAAAGAAIGGVFLVFMLVFIALAFALFIFWIFMLIDAFKRTNWKDDNQKNMWIIILIVGFVVGFSGIAAIVYYFAVKRSLDKGSAAPAPAATQPTPPTDKK